MLAVFLTVSLGSCWAGLQYESFKKTFLAPAPAGNLVVHGEKRQQILFSLDTVIAWALFARVIRFNASVAIANWRHTRGQRIPLVPSSRAVVRSKLGTPQTTQPQSASIKSFILNAWRDVFRGRDALLIRHYRSLAAVHGVELDEVCSAWEARQRFYDALPSALPPSEPELDAMERKSLLVQRASSAWIVLWTTIIPVAIVSYQLIRMPPMIWNAAGPAVAWQIAKRFILAVVGFAGLAIIGAIVQGLLLRLFFSRRIRPVKSPGSTD
jgi:hypothetical protein